MELAHVYQDGQEIDFVQVNNNTSSSRHPTTYPQNNDQSLTQRPQPTRHHTNNHPSWKRLIVCADGTWLNSDDGTKNGKLEVPSNVTRISRAILPESRDGVQQVVYYHYGVASQGAYLDRVLMGATGAGLSDNVRQAYSFLSNNYSPGDEIYLIGFSRGAYTVRAIAGIISIVGLLTKKGLKTFPAVFKDVQHRRDRRYRSKNPDVPFPNKPSASDPRYKQELTRRGLTDPYATVKAIGVWDTVGSLGFPRLSLLTKAGLQDDQSQEMSFYDTKLSSVVEHAFQALALDERRSAFAPAVWEKPANNTTKLRQVWFPGVHSNVGGGYDDQELANITLAWMMSQLAPFLDFDPDYILEQADENEIYYREEWRRKNPRPWSFGTLYNSLTGVFALGGGTTRTPGRYCTTDQEGKSTRKPLRDTHEYIHASVRTRFRLRGPGSEDKGEYVPEALVDDWKLVVEYDAEGRGGAEGPHVYWRARFRDEGGGGARVLPEAPLWGVERELLGLDGEMERVVYRPPASRKS